MIVFCAMMPAIASQGSGAVKRTYTWDDFDGVKRIVTFTVLSTDVSDSEKEFGASASEMGPQKITFGYRVKYPPNASPKIIRKLREIAKANSERKARDLIVKKKSRLLSKGYVTIGGEKVGVDLSAAWNRNRQRIRAYVQQFVSQTGICPDILPSQALAFVQHIKYKKPPNLRAGSCILQFYPPIEALNAGYGDCDTKTILFASMVDDGNGLEVIALRGPDHVLAGLECEPDAEGYVIRVFNKSFLLCECSAPSWPPGKLSKTIYDAIERGDYTPIRLRTTSPFDKTR